MDPKLVAALTDFFDTLDVYLMANWDEHARKRLRVRGQAVYALLKAEQKRLDRQAAKRKAEASDAP